MSARKSDAGLSVRNESSSTECLTLPADSVVIRKNGLEFCSHKPIEQWTELTVTLQRTGDDQRMRCTGVIVACTGSPKEGYQISMLFTYLSRQSQVMLLGYL